MKKWIEKLVHQFEITLDEDNLSPSKTNEARELPTEEQATLLFIIDFYNKHLLEIDGHSVRKIRSTLDEFAQQILTQEDKEKVLFRFRNFFSSYRIDEYAYILKTFDEFRNIIWDFVDQIAEDLSGDEGDELQSSLSHLKEAVESNSIEDLKTQSREFIDNYTEYQHKKEKLKSLKLEAVKLNLNKVKRKLVEAHHSMQRDHLTNAYNRKSFDEQISQHWKLAQISGQNLSLLILDIDHFKKINDTYGHPIGDFVLQECVKSLQVLFHRQCDFVARIGGEEFAVILPDYQVQHAIKKSEEVLKYISQQKYVQDDHQISFTMSVGIAQLLPSENVKSWIQRADEALYESKKNGRNQFTVHTAHKNSHLQSA